MTKCLACGEPVASEAKAPFCSLKCRETHIVGYEVYGHDVDEPLKVNPEEAIFCYLEYKDREDWPKQVIVQAYQRGPVIFPVSRLDIEEIYAAMDELYGDPEGNYDQTDFTLKKIDDAWEVFKKVVEETWMPWRCDPIPGLDQSFIIADFLELHSPSWLEGCEQRILRITGEG